MTGVRGSGDGGLDDLVDELRSRVGLGLAAFPRSMVARGVRRRVDEAGGGSATAYRSVLQGDPAEFARLSHSVLVNATGFYRDRHAWDILARRVLPALARHRDRGEALAGWSAGCASGEEPYTLAMVMAEAVRRGPKGWEAAFLVHATDVDVEALAQVERGSYASDEVGGLPARLRRRYLDRADGGFRIRPALATRVLPRRHDLAREPPIAPVDVVICRHTLMYFDPGTQRRILEAFDSALRPDGVLFLERTDRLLSLAERFVAVDPLQPIYCRRGSALAA